MTETKKVVRLSKAAREFNISIDTVVGFLTDKGYNIERKPNTKLEPKMYELLTTEFQDEKLVKEVAIQKGLEYVRRESTKIEPVKDEKEEVTNKPADKELIIKNTGISYHDNRPSIENHQDVESNVAAQNEVLKPDIKEPEGDNEVTEEAIEKIVEKAPVVIPEVIEDKFVELADEPTAEVVVEEIKDEVSSETKEEAPIDIDIEVEENTIVEKIIEVETPKASEPVEEVKEEVKEKVDDAPVSVESPVTESEDVNKGDSSSINILGTIDLESINQKTRPTKKSKEERKRERDKKNAEANKNKAKQKPSKDNKQKEKPVKKTQVNIEEKKIVKQSTPPPVGSAKKPEAVKEVQKKVSEKTVEKKDNFIETKVEKLTGPVLTGEKIDLAQFAKKKPASKKPANQANRNAAGKKRKRKRIPGTPQTAKNVEHSKGGKSSFKKKPFGKNRPKPFTKTEPTEEEIQKKIKDTLARLAPGGKSKSAKHRRRKRDVVSETHQQELQKQESEKKIIKVTEFVTANEMATMMNVGVTEIITVCMQLGLFVSINQRLDAETIVVVAEEFGYQTSFVGVDDNEDLEVNEEDDNPEDLVSRAPIVTVMGHVDHGKTKLLDYIRHANVVSGEAGGITQHIGAYEVTTDSGKKITFLDTPGHEAFTAMRARGAKVTDVAIIVIAADDSVMPQTKEAINHAQAAGVPIVFAINKMDKEGANAEKVKEQLANMNILLEDWGGKFQSQEISAITGMGINELLEKVLLESEMLELKANPNKLAKGTVVEATLDKGRGYVTTILVQDGTLRKGDILLAGPIFGKVKAMFDENNLPVIEAGPSTPVVLLGLVAAPQAGDIINGMKDEKEAKSLASKRQQLLREQGLRTQKHLTLDEIGRRIAIGEFKELNVIVKGDVDGSIEALTDALLKLSTTEVQVNVIHKAVGAISESDVMLASASDAIIIGFQVRPSAQARKLAEKEEIDIRLYSIIYQATEELETAIKGMLAPKFEEKITCNIEVRETFRITKVGTIAGCYVLDGKVNRNTSVRIIRDGIVVYTGALGSLKRFKDDVKEVSKGYECGLNIENYNDIKVGDIVEGYEMVEIKR